MWQDQIAIEQVSSIRVADRCSQVGTSSSLIFPMVPQFLVGGSANTMQVLVREKAPGLIWLHRIINAIFSLLIR
jgi:hypothetical protein